MDLSFLTKETLMALSAALMGIGALIAKVWGSGKERMDFQSINRDALRDLLKDLQESFKSALLENKELRQKWNDDLTAWEMVKKDKEKLEDDLLQRALIAESKIEILRDRLVRLEKTLELSVQQSNINLGGNPQTDIKTPDSHESGVIT